MDYFQHNARKGQPSPLYRALRRDAREPRNDRQAHTLLVDQVNADETRAVRLAKARAAFLVSRGAK